MYHAILETRRTRRFNVYIILCWAIIIALVRFFARSYLYKAHLCIVRFLNRLSRGYTWMASYFLASGCFSSLHCAYNTISLNVTMSNCFFSFWAVQTNCILQVIINRICILIHNPQRKVRSYTRLHMVDKITDIYSSFGSSYVLLSSQLQSISAVRSVFCKLVKLGSNPIL